MNERVLKVLKRGFCVQLFKYCWKVIHQTDGNRLVWTLFRTWQTWSLWTVIWSRAAWRFFKMSPFMFLKKIIAYGFGTIWGWVNDSISIQPEWFHYDHYKAAWEGKITSRSIMSRGNGTSGFSPVSIIGMLAFLISFSTNPAEHDNSTKLLWYAIIVWLFSQRRVSFCVLFNGKFCQLFFCEPLHQHNNAGFSIKITIFYLSIF